MFLKRAFRIFVPQLNFTRYSSRSTNVPLEDIDLEFKGLETVAKNPLNKASGPDPIYLKLRDDMYNIFYRDKSFNLKLGGVLPELRLAYETWGDLSPEKDNAILLFTGLSANSHAKQNVNNINPGWWEDFIGEKMAIDTDKFFVICVNHLGSCFGSTGPSTISPVTKEPYGTNFPMLTVDDMVKAQFLLLDYLGIEKLHASVGSSLGGMCSLLSGLKYPSRVSK